MRSSSRSLADRDRLRALTSSAQAAFDDGHFPSSFISCASADRAWAAARSSACISRVFSSDCRMLSLVADSSAKGVAQLAIDRLWAGDAGRGDFRMRWNIHLAHLLDGQARIGIGECVPIKYELPVKRCDFHRHSRLPPVLFWVLQSRLIHQRVRALGQTPEPQRLAARPSYWSTIMGVCLRLSKDHRQTCPWHPAWYRS